MRRIKRLSGIVLSVVMALSTVLSSDGMVRNVYADELVVEYEEDAVQPEEVVQEDEEESVAVQDEIVSDDELSSEEVVFEEAITEENDEEEITEEVAEEDEIGLDDSDEDIASDGWGDTSGEEYDNTIYDDLDYVLGDIPVIEEIETESIYAFADDMPPEERALYEDGAGIPASYPVTDKAGKSKSQLITELLEYAEANYPALRNQGSYGTCWAHASTALAEISMIKQGKASAATVDYSELALAYFMMHTVVDPIGGTEGDANRDGLTHDWLKGGGNVMYSSKALANWTGSTLESEVPYTKAADVYDNGLDGSYAFKDAAHLENFYQTDVADRDSVKKLIMENGAASVSYHAADSSKGELTSTYYNATNNCWYYPKAVGTNHAVTIVGWDDDFSKDNFNAVNGQKPAGNGAWLIRNSWYVSSENKYSYRGYFWISYYDANISTSFSFKYSDGENYENNYQYDGAALSGTFSSNNIFSAANVFEIKAEEDGEELKAVSFCTSGVTNQEYTVDIYVNSENGDPTSGTLMEESTVSGMTTYSGYYTVTLPNPVILGKGDRVAVVLTLKKTGDRPGIMCEYPSKGSWMECATKAKSNQSYWYDSSTDKWMDFGKENNCNLRIKAFTDKIDPSEEWKVEKHNVNYVLNGGKNNALNPSFVRWITPDVTLEEPSREGYTFGGWYKDSAFTEEISVIETGQTSEVTVYAKWIECKYNIVFNANGGTGSMSSMQNIMYSKEYTLTANKFSRKGYTFKNWNTKKDGSGTAYANSAKVKNLTKTNGASVTLYAQWNAVSYSITYKLNGGKNNSKNPSSYKITSKTITLASPTRKGYKFAGWYSNSKCTKKVTKIAKGSTGNKTLYAKWSIVKYTIKYKLNGGKNNSKNPSSYKVTSASIKLKSPTRKGYTFAGWYTDKNYKNKISKIAKGSSGNKTLYAKWKKKTYTITYYLNGGLNISMNPTTYTVTTKTINLVAPIKSGYSFGGWYSDASFKNRVTSIKKGSTGNKKLYAKWISGTYTLRFSGNGATGGSMDDVKGIAYEQVITLPENKYYKDGYSFYGWNTKSDGSGEWAKNGQPVKGLGTRDGEIVVIYAIWS